MRAFSTSSGTRLTAKSIEAFKEEAGALAAKYQLVGTTRAERVPGGGADDGALAPGDSLIRSRVGSTSSSCEGEPMGPDEGEQRLIDMEIKLSHQEATVESLQQTVYEQQKALDVLERKVTRLAKLIESSAEGGQDIGPANEKPPHY